MGTPTHTYCSLRDLLKNQPSPNPKFKNHSFSRTKVELQDFYTNMPIDHSVLDGSSSRKKPSSNSRLNNAKGKSKKPADHDEKGLMVEPFKGYICHTKKSIERSAENGKQCLEMGPADKGGANEDSEEEDDKEKEKEKEVAESEEDETEEGSVMVESEEEIEVKSPVVESDEE